MHANRLSRQHQRLQYVKRAGPSLCPLNKQYIPLSRSTTQVLRLQSHHCTSVTANLHWDAALFFINHNFCHKTMSFGKYSSSGWMLTSSKHLSQKSSPWLTICSHLSLYMFHCCKIPHYGWELNKDCNKSNMDLLDCYQDRQSLAD